MDLTSSAYLLMGLGVVFLGGRELERMEMSSVIRHEYHKRLRS